MKNLNFFLIFWTLFFKFYNVNKIYGNNENKIQPFTSINITGFGAFFYNQGDEYSVSLEIDPRFSKFFDIKTVNGVLNISFNTEFLKNHKIISYNVKSDLLNDIKIKTDNIEGNIAFFKTQNQVYYLENGKIFKTSAQDLEDLIKIKITCPYLESIKLNGKINFDMKNNKSNLFTESLYIISRGDNKIKINQLKIKKVNFNIKNNTNISIDNIETKIFKYSARDNSSVNIGKLNSNKLFCQLYNNSKFDILDLNAESLININLCHNSLFNIKNTINSHNLSFSLSSNTIIEGHSIKSDLLKVKLTDNSKLYFKEGNIKKSNLVFKNNSICEIPNVSIEEAHIKVKGNSKGSINVLKKISKNISDNANITISGYPKIINKSKISSKKGN